MRVVSIPEVREGSNPPKTTEMPRSQQLGVARGVAGDRYTTRHLCGASCDTNLQATSVQVRPGCVGLYELPKDLHTVTKDRPKDGLSIIYTQD